MKEHQLGFNIICSRQWPRFTLQSKKKQKQHKNTPSQQPCVGQKVQKVSERSGYEYKASSSSKILNLGSAVIVLQAGPTYNAMFHGASVCTCYKLMDGQVMDREVKHVLIGH